MWKAQRTTPWLRLLTTTRGLIRQPRRMEPLLQPEAKNGTHVVIPGWVFYDNKSIIIHDTLGK
jgi:hypothetical protein